MIPSTHTPDPPTTAVDLDWLITLRWAAIAGQVATIAGVQLFLDLELPALPLALIIIGEAVTNGLAHVWLQSPREIPDRVPFGILAIDVLALTGLLYFTGGAHNPFNFLYLVYIALAAVVLRPASTWALAVLSVVAFGGLFFRSVPLGGEHAGHGAGAADMMALHLQGMWVAFTVGAAFIVYFVTRVKRALAERDLALSLAREAAVRTERLASLATLAAGAAHELATPLGTIAIVARELELDLADGPPSAVEDARLIRSQVARCRTVLDQLAVDAGGVRGESRQEGLHVRRLVKETLEGLASPARVEATVPEHLEEHPLPGYPSTLAQMLRAVIRNALDASDGESTVQLEVSESDGQLRIRVRDEGCGMSEETLARATEPFFTTKETGRGMGLGLFLTRTTLERLGGKLVLESRLGQGATVDLLLPSG
jgi:two-component system, sensor histidine kinase RegB